MNRNNLSIEKKLVMVPTLIMEGIMKIPIIIQTKHEFAYGKHIPTEFKEGIKYLPLYKIIKMPKLI